MNKKLLREYVKFILSENDDDRGAVKLAQAVYGSSGATNTPLADMNEIIAAAALSKGSDITTDADALANLNQQDAKDRLKLRLDQIESGVQQGIITVDDKLRIIQNEINLGNQMAARVRTDAAVKKPGLQIKSGFWTGAAGAMSGSSYGTEDVIAIMSNGDKIKYSLKRNKAAANTKGNPGFSEYNKCLPDLNSPGSCSMKMNSERIKIIADNDKELTGALRDSLVTHFPLSDPNQKPSTFKSPNRLRDALVGKIDGAAVFTDSSFDEQEFITNILAAAAKEIAGQLTNSINSTNKQSAKSFVENAIEGDTSVDVVTPDKLYSSSATDSPVQKLATAVKNGSNYVFEHDGSVGIKVSAMLNNKEKLYLFRVRIKFSSANSGWGVKATVE